MMNSFRAYKLKLPRISDSPHKNEIKSENLLFYEGDVWKTPVKNKFLIGDVAKSLCFDMSPKQSLPHRTQGKKRSDLLNQETGDVNSIEQKNTKEFRDAENKSPTPEIVACKFCDRTFSYSCHLKVHERIHTGEKPYHCTECSKTFSQLGSLTVHKRIHTGEKPYSCEKCPKRFRHINSLRRHQRQVHLMKKAEVLASDEMEVKATPEITNKRQFEEINSSEESKRMKLNEANESKSWSSLTHTCAGEVVDVKDTFYGRDMAQLALYNYYTALLEAGMLSYDKLMTHIPGTQPLVTNEVLNPTVAHRQDGTKSKVEYSSSDEGFASNTSDDGKLCEESISN